MCGKTFESLPLASQCIDAATVVVELQPHLLISPLSFLCWNHPIPYSPQPPPQIDPLLTPTGKKLQDGTRAVARQLASDILPGIANAVGSGPAGAAGSPAAAVVSDLPTLVPKLGSRILDAVTNQARSNLEQLQGDLADPTRIPKRLRKQANGIATEAKNVFKETPEGLIGPKYTVLSSGEGYEVREYGGYSVATTSMAKEGETYSVDDVASGGAAFNALAAYLFGANDQKTVMDMTTPVSTTSLGEMRFFLRPSTEDQTFPLPLNEEDERYKERGAVEIKEIPQARLAVARFSGFVTQGEVLRQKDALLSSLAADGLEVDVPHGVAVPHVVFQYNPPYTIPIVRRNEIAVPVRELGDDGASDPVTEWEDAIGGKVAEGEDDASSTEFVGSDGDDVSPSDIE